MRMDDEEIIRLYWDRNEQAIPATADKYGNYCTSIAKNILGNCEDAEECVNDTYLHAWNAIPPHRPNRLSAFLGKIVRNISFNRYKRNRADKRGGGQTAMVFWTAFHSKRKIFLCVDIGILIVFPISRFGLE